MVHSKGAGVVVGAMEMVGAALHLNNCCFATRWQAARLMRILSLAWNTNVSNGW